MKNRRKWKSFTMKLKNKTKWNKITQNKKLNWLCKTNAKQYIFLYFQKHFFLHRVIGIEGNQCRTHILVRIWLKWSAVGDGTPPQKKIQNKKNNWLLKTNKKNTFFSQGCWNRRKPVQAIPSSTNMTKMADYQQWYNRRASGQLSRRM